MKQCLTIGLLILLSASSSVAQDSLLAMNRPAVYEQGYREIEILLQENKPGNFKKAVFVTENSFLNQTLTFSSFESKIKQMAFLAGAWAKANGLPQYRLKDSFNMALNYAIYTLMKDSIKIVGKDPSQDLTTIPLLYDFTDFNGKKDWTKMFVTKLLYTYSGNCHSLPYLYKILADELGAACWLSLAPNHIYIKNRSQKSGWYNTELTSGSFPIDAWITASGYIPLQAIQNGIYMDTLSNQQAIALCLLDLAKGYEFQTRNYEGGFIIKCCDLVLKYHPTNVQAILLKAETLKRTYQAKAKKRQQAAKDIYTQMEKSYTQLFELGYREMPESMYIDWLKSLNTEKAKYQNKNL